MTEAEAFTLYQMLKARGEEVHYIDRNSSAFKKGLTVTTFYLAKGLEFDQVFGVFRDIANPMPVSYTHLFIIDRKKNGLYILFIFTAVCFNRSTCK